jgi:hypothetical protein
MSLAEQVGPDVAPFIRWLTGTGDWTVRDLIEVLHDARVWEFEFREWQRETRQRATPEECEGEEWANR